MKLIVITEPGFIPGEAQKLTQLFEHGLPLLHLRKPEATEEEVEALLRQLPTAYHERIVLHQHFSLTTRYGLRGVHLNHRHPLPPQGYQGQISCSCHSLEEVAHNKSRCHYLFLSPIFSSISKRDYPSAFSPTQLAEARDNGLIDEQVVALGGVTLAHLPQLQEWGFGGIALLGNVWQQPDHLFISHFEQIIKAIHHE